MLLDNIYILGSSLDLSSLFGMVEKFNQSSPYISAGLLFLLALIMGLVMLFAGVLIRERKPGKDKNAPYECGMEPIGDAQERVKPRYYIYAMLFLAFDIELLFMIPWAVVFKDLEATGYGDVAFFEMILFIVILFVGLIYAWMKGALEWD